jgi:hypothetical protein
MENTLEIAWYSNLDWSMIWVCFGAVIALTLYMMIHVPKLDQTKSYLKPTWKNYAYQFVSAFVMLSFVSEVGFKAVNYFLNLDIDVANDVLHFLAALSGLGGGYVFEKIIKLFQKK